MAHVVKIVSGGQTGVDRAALDVASELGIVTGGWVPLGRLAEDGRVPDRYVGLTETESTEYAVRTEKNVRDSDATLVLSAGPPTGGTALTETIAKRLGKPLFSVDLVAIPAAQAQANVETWLAQVVPRVLNVAGPRASKAPELDSLVREVLAKVLAKGAA